MMGAVINIGAVIGEGTMIDMGAVLGGRATVGKNCHIGAGTVLAGVVEPASATPVIVEDNVLIGANAASDAYGQFLATGILLLISGQAVINLLMVGGLLPVIGVPPPMYRESKS